jgi:hypothetical protein
LDGTVITAKSWFFLIGVRALGTITPAADEWDPTRVFFLLWTERAS